MSRWSTFLWVVLALSLAACDPGVIQAIAATSVAIDQNEVDVCLTTNALTPPFVPPPPYPGSAPYADQFWYGTESLWTMLPRDGIWSGLPKNPQGYTQKLFWWQKDYIWHKEPNPDLTVTGQRLDAPAPPLQVWPATNAFAKDIQSAMLIGVDFPTLGCWEITGHYAGTELSYVVYLAP